MTSSPRRLLLWVVLPVLVIGLPLAGYGIYWQQVAGRLQAGVAQWAADQRTAGATIDFQWHGITGFPFAFTAEFTGVTILGRLGGTALSARTDHLQLNVSPVDLNAVRLLCDKPLTVIVPGLSLGQASTGGSAAGSTGGATTGAGDGAAGVRLTVEQADGMVRLRDGNPVGATIDASKGKLDNGQSNLAVASLHVSVQLPATLPHDFKDPAANIEINVSGVDLPADAPQLLPGPITEAGLVGTIKGPLLPPPAVERPRDLTGILAQWRDAGGVLDLSSFDFAQGPLTLSGSGTFALDANLQPIGASKVTATGLGDLIDLLTARGELKRKEAGIAKAVITGLQRPAENGRQEVTVGLSIEDSIVSFGAFKLLRLPPIAWPH
ncbi:MAG TPA: DUF2125 domain-containing protein [Dongiaceae bacterium]